MNTIVKQRVLCDVSSRRVVFKDRRFYDEKLWDDINGQTLQPHFDPKVCFLISAMPMGLNRYWRCRKIPCPMVPGQDNQEIFINGTKVFLNSKSCCVKRLERQYFRRIIIIDHSVDR